MAILERPKIQAQQRFDLEDWNALLGNLRSDSKFYTKNILCETNKILNGFTVTGLGATTATVVMSGATMIVPENTTDFSYYTAPSGVSNITIPATDLTNSTQNYVEVILSTLDGTPATKAFWDADSNSGLGSEFQQEVNTSTTLTVSVSVNTSGFTGGDYVPLAILGLDSSGLIKTIFDQRPIFGRLALPTDLDNDFAWGTKVESLYTAVLTGGSGTFVTGETITFAGTETATVVTGGTTSMTFKRPSAFTFEEGDAVVGTTSGASRTLVSSSEAFSGVDKNINTLEDALKAVMTEIKAIKGSLGWWDTPAIDLAAIAIATALPNQDRNISLVEGGAWSVVDNAGTYELTNSADAYIQLPDFAKARNTILAQTISLPNDNSIAYVSINRTDGVTANLTVTVVDDDAATIDDDFVVIARRVTGGVQVGCKESFIVGLESDLDWDTAKTYRGDIVTKDFVSYISKTNANVGNDPATDFTNWGLLNGKRVSSGAAYGAVASYNGDTITLTGEGGGPKGGYDAQYLRADGLKMFFADKNDVYAYTMSTANDPSTLTYDTVTYASSEAAAIKGIFFAPDGLKMWLVDDTNDSVYQYTLATAWLLTSATYDSVVLDLSSQTTAPKDLKISGDGLHLYTIGTTTVYEYTMGGAWDLDGAAYSTNSLSVAAQDGTPVSLAVDATGANFIVLGTTNDAVFLYDFGGTAWSLSGAAYATQSFSVADGSASATNVSFSGDGTKIILNDALVYDSIIYAYDTRIDYQNDIGYIGSDSGAANADTNGCDKSANAYAIYRGTSAFLSNCNRFQVRKSSTGIYEIELPSGLTFDDIKLVNNGATTSGALLVRVEGSGGDTVTITIASGVSSGATLPLLNSAFWASFAVVRP